VRQVGYQHEQVIGLCKGDGVCFLWAGN